MPKSRGNEDFGGRAASGKRPATIAPSIAGERSVGYVADLEKRTPVPTLVFKGPCIAAD